MDKRDPAALSTNTGAARSQLGGEVQVFAAMYAVAASGS